MARLVQRKDFPHGDEEFEADRKKIVQSVLDKIPKELVLPGRYIDNAPSDVKGVPRESGLLTEQELDITENYDLVALSEAIASKELSSVAVTTAFCKRACIAHQLTFCLTELYMEEAIQRAKEVDEHLNKTGQVLGPLHGVPISLKEMIPVKGQLTSIGLKVTRNIPEEDCVLVDILREMGAVFYVKTHQPAAVFATESTSFLGRTLNPSNLDLSPGGSSGGEGALLAMKGSVLGFGTDIGGSIRLPASYSGVYGLKGSSGFLPLEGMLSGPFPAGMNLDGIVGPMGRSLRDIDHIVSLLRATKPWLRDQLLVPTPYTGLKGTNKSKSNLKIGLIKDYATIQPQPPITQILSWVESQLKSANFNVSQFKPHDPYEGHKLFGSLTLVDGWKMTLEGFAAAREPTYPLFEQLTKQFCTERMDPKAVLGQEESGLTVSAKKWQRDVFRKEFLKSWVEQGNPDIVIAPMNPAPAHDSTGNLYTTLASTWIWNVLDYPGLIVPTPFKVEGKDKYDTKAYEDGEPWNDDDKEARQTWKDTNSVGAPICLQILAKRHMESDLIEGVGLIKEALQLP